jgi:hypothetical protein
VGSVGVADAIGVVARVVVVVMPAGPVRIEDGINGGAAQAKLLGRFFAGLDVIARKTPATESGNPCKSFWRLTHVSHCRYA